MATWADWDTALARVKLGVTPAEMHGSMTGYLCAGWGGRAHELLTALALESGDSGADGTLYALLDAAARDIHDRFVKGTPVEPLLPEGSVPVRADAMLAWCRGFLGGLGLTGILEKRGQSPDTDGVLADFGRIASMHLECDDDDADSLADVLDFIRAGVLHLHAAFAPTPHP